MKKNKKTGKKAEMSSKVLISWILLIIGFGIVLLFFYMFNWTGEVDKQACHSSVIFKATVPELKDQKVVELPLQCETEKICVSSNLILNGNCDKDFMGEKYQTLRVSGDAKQMNDEVNKIVADKLYECWQMMGQGKVQIYSRNTEWFDSSGNRICNLCTRIAFDDNVKTNLNNKLTGSIKYLTTNNIPNEAKTYQQYLSNSESNYISGYDESKDVMDLSQKAIIFAEVSKSVLLEWLGEGAGTVGGAVVGAKIGFIVPLPGSTFVGMVIGGIAGYWASDNLHDAVDTLTSDDKDQPPVAGVLRLYDYNFETLKKIKCLSFEGKV